MIGFIFGALLFGLPPQAKILLLFFPMVTCLISCFGHLHVMLEGAAHLAISRTVDVSATEY